MRPNVNADMISAAMLKQRSARSRATYLSGDVEMLNAVREGTRGRILEGCSPAENGELKAIGVDGCKSGWFWVALSPSRRPDWGVVEKVEDLLPDVGGSDRIFVDIPIGLLTKQSRRTCDRNAQSMLTGRSSCVFSAPVRAVLDTNSYEDAKRRSQEACGEKISQQVWAIVSKIREVDLLMRGNDKARHFVREVHPELCFWALNDGHPMKSKKKGKLGFEERISVLSRWLPAVESLVSSVRKQFLVKDVGHDDIADALAAAVTALADPSTWRTVPEDPPRDDFDLPMEMVYADPDLLKKHPLKTA